MPEGDDGVVSTLCVEWSLNVEKGTNKRFWWNSAYSISVWEDVLGIRESDSKITDTHVWRSFIDYQIGYVFKLCPICREPEGNEDMKICCYCGNTVHIACSQEASSDQIAWKPANAGREKYFRVCFACEGKECCLKKDPSSGIREPDSVRRATLRSLSMGSELNDHITRECNDILSSAEAGRDEERLMYRLQKTMQLFFQPNASHRFVKKEKIASKGGGVGVVAACDIPAYTIVGVYPGYRDDFSGEQGKLGRPVPKYALMDLNCANYYNEVFVELQETFTPFINEPCESESSNCAWIQEPIYREGRLSIITVKNIMKGAELLIGYGPLYPRNYTYSYDAYALHPVEGFSDFHCFALWHWPSKDENTAVFVCYLRYNEDSRQYIYWETQEESDQRATIDTGKG